ncbi:sensor histidine kinase [Lacibacter sp. H407]|uniref:sensor histidine kinase n=1 Tax=Lacibacter sp. H407 TaxID=3133423 RepID=UPI0030C08E95
MTGKRAQHIIYCYFLFLFICLTGNLHAQELRYSFKNYTTSDGLPSSEVHKVWRDAKNYMWFATDHGVCRYNGYRFETFNLPDNSILGLYEDYKKRIWVHSFSGQLFYYENGKFEEYKWNSKLVDVIKPGVINALYVDSSDALYISSTGPHTYMVSKDGTIKDLLSIQNKIQYKAFPTTATRFFTYVSSYPGKFNIGEPLPVQKTNIAVRLGGKEVNITIPLIYRPERFRIRQFSNDKALFFSNEVLIWIYADGRFDLQKPAYRIYDIEEINGLFYMATEKGLLIQNKNGDVLAEYFSNKHITSLAKDHEGGLWFTSLLDGVFYLSSTRTRHLAKDGIIINRKINVLYNLADTGIVAGTFDGSVVQIIPGAVWDEVKIKAGQVVDIKQKDNSSFYVGVSLLGWPESLTRRYGRQFSYTLIPSLSNILLTDTVVIAGQNDNITRVNLNRVPELTLMVGKVSFRVSKVFLNDKNELLVGNLFGLWKYVDRELLLYDSSKPLLQSRITDIVEYKDQMLFLGTRGKGLLIADNDSVTQVTEADGLVSNNIRKIFIDDDRIWLATNKGLSLLTVLSTNPFSCNIKNINVQDGLLSNEINDVVKSGNYIVVGTNSGISYLDRNYFIKRENEPLPFYIRGVRLNGNLVDSGRLNKLGFKNRNLSVTYEALRFNNPGQLRYRYRLSGYDSTWFYTSDLQVQFNPLPYGEYVLEIQAKSELEDWNSSSNLISLPIVCHAPFWSSAWFWIFIFSLIIFLLVLSFRNRIRFIRQKEKEEKELQKRISESEQMALKAQMNPHFIFNSLNSIQQYVIDRDVEGANSFISGFSKLMRQTLEFSSKERISLEEEIAYLSNYLDLEKARMESSFLYKVIVQTEQPPSQLDIPPLLLQPYVENALRHGVRYLKAGEGLITLSFQEYPGVLLCTIEDNGVGRGRAMELKAVNPIEYQSRGMSLTAERIALLNEEKEKKIEVVIEDLKDENGKASGTRIQVLFPI